LETGAKVKKKDSERTFKNKEKRRVRVGGERGSGLTEHVAREPVTKTTRNGLLLQGKKSVKRLKEERRVEEEKLTTSQKKKRFEQELGENQSPVPARNAFPARPRRKTSRRKTSKTQKPKEAVPGNGWP